MVNVMNSLIHALIENLLFKLFWFLDCLLFFILDSEVSCVRGLTSWRDSASAINDEIYKGFSKGNSAGKINEIVGG